MHACRPCSCHAVHVHACFLPTHACTPDRCVYACEQHQALLLRRQSHREKSTDIVHRTAPHWSNFVSPILKPATYQELYTRWISPSGDLANNPPPGSCSFGSSMAPPLGASSSLSLHLPDLRAARFASVRVGLRAICPAQCHLDRIVVVFICPS